MLTRQYQTLYQSRDNNKCITLILWKIKTDKTENCLIKLYRTCKTHSQNKELPIIDPTFSQSDFIFKINLSAITELVPACL